MKIGTLLTLSIMQAIGQRGIAEVLTGSRDHPNMWMAQCNENIENTPTFGPYTFNDSSGARNVIRFLRLQNIGDGFHVNVSETGTFSVNFSTYGHITIPLHKTIQIVGELENSAQRPWYSCTNGTAPPQWCDFYMLKTDAESVPAEHSHYFHDRTWIVWSFNFVCKYKKSYNTPFLLSSPTVLLNITLTDEFDPYFEVGQIQRAFPVSELTAGKELITLTDEAKDKDIGVHGQLRYAIANDSQFLIQIEENKQVSSHPFGYTMMHPWVVRLKINITASIVPTDRTFRLHILAMGPAAGSKSAKLSFNILINNVGDSTLSDPVPRSTRRDPVPHTTRRKPVPHTNPSNPVPHATTFHTAEDSTTSDTDYDADNVRRTTGGFHPMDDGDESFSISTLSMMSWLLVAALGQLLIIGLFVWYKYRHWKKATDLLPVVFVAQHSHAGSIDSMGRPVKIIPLKPPAAIDPNVESLSTFESGVDDDESSASTSMYGSSYVSSAS